MGRILSYNEVTMIVQNAWCASECYTYPNWAYPDVCINFSRLYYIVDGEGYYEENGCKVRLKKNHLYLTPVEKKHSLMENAENKLFRTHTHIRTFPPVDRFTEIPVEEGTPLADAVALWRKHIHTKDGELLCGTVQLVLSCLGGSVRRGTSVAEQTKEYLDRMEPSFLNMKDLSGALGYSREHITRSFQAMYHVTPKQYFNQRVMNLALEQLLGGARVYEVAEGLNYSSAYAFSRAFKQRFGMSPEKYLRTLPPKNG